MQQSLSLASLREWWNSLPRARQLAVAGLAVVALAALFYVVSLSRKPNLVVAYSGLAPEDSAAIADQLEKDGIPYQIGAGGSSVAVPANKVAEVRIKLAQAGLPKGGGVGFELFDQTKFGVTDFEQKVNFRRALEGELARSINTLDAVRASRVHINIPEETLFREDEKPATASVLLQLRPGASLSDDQIRGIVNLVANSVEGLEPKHITVIDQSGRVLYDGAAADGNFVSGATTTQLELQRQYELALQRDLENTLAKVVGPGRSAVTVRALLNFDAVTETSDQFASPENAVVRSQSTVTETFTGTNLTVGNIPGTGTNGGPNAGAGTNATGNSEYTRTETTVNNEISRTTTTTVRAPGRVERLSVSVVLDESVPAAQESAIMSAVAAAVGLDQTRGDTLSVTRLPFDASVREAFVFEGGSAFAQYLQYVRYVLPVLAVVLAFVLVMLLARSLAKRQQAWLRSVPQPRMTATVEPPPAVAPAPELHPLPDPTEERVLKLAATNPRAVADVVQTWLREESA